MKVYLICSNVDLGYCVDEVLLDEQKARIRAANLNHEYNQQYIRNLMGIGYTAADALASLSNEPHIFCLEMEAE